MAIKKSSSNKLAATLQLLIILAILVAVNILGNYFFQRIDLTEDKRFSLSKPTKNLIKDLEDIVYIKVYLEGDFPADIKRLRDATKEILMEFKAYGGENFEYEFIDPTNFDDPNQKKQFLEALIEKGLIVVPVRSYDGDEYTEKTTVPGLIVNYKGREFPIIITEAQKAMSNEERVNSSISMLEYKMSNAIQKLKEDGFKTVAFSVDHGELENAELQSLADELSRFYFVKRVDLKKQIVLDPKEVEVLVIARPTQPFERPEKFVIDQYIMNGGKVMWFIDPLAAALDSIGGGKEFVTSNYNLNLEDQLFKYGARINDDLVQDAQCGYIPILVGYIEDEPQTTMDKWYFNPILNPQGNSPITKNLGLVYGQFVSSLDTVNQNPKVKKTVLLTTSKYSRYLRNPVQVSLDATKLNLTEEQLNKPYLPAAVLLEGEFTSVFKNRLFESMRTFLDSMNISVKEEGVETKMLVVSDGDLIRNEVRGDGSILPLGTDQFSGKRFSNKEFFVNALEYLVDNTGLMETRNKEFTLRLLDRGKVKEEKRKWQFINFVMPLLIVLWFGVMYNFIRKRKYAR